MVRKSLGHERSQSKSKTRARKGSFGRTRPMRLAGVNRELLGITAPAFPYGSTGYTFKFWVAFLKSRLLCKSVDK